MFLGFAVVVDCQKAHYSASVRFINLRPPQLANAYLLHLSLDLVSLDWLRTECAPARTRFRPSVSTEIPTVHHLHHSAALDLEPSDWDNLSAVFQIICRYHQRQQTLTQATLTVAAAIAGADSSRKLSTAATAKEESVKLRARLHATYHPRPCEAPGPRRRVLVFEETESTTTGSELRILFGGLLHLGKRL